ncbi:hypothetical protein [Roseburia inulinivorans]|uniref:hypothetical protein n=1 Tax=Roseburia inulinivorans TaxID=360807 RepID=UPI00268A59B3|nr:hypothetical protein [Roseburia inulinivorans]
MKEKITLSLDQHENARHGEEIFPLQKYVTRYGKSILMSRRTGMRRQNLHGLGREAAHIRSILKLMMWKREI